MPDFTLIVECINAIKAQIQLLLLVSIYDHVGEIDAKMLSVVSRYRNICDTMAEVNDTDYVALGLALSKYSNDIDIDSLNEEYSKSVNPGDLAVLRNVISDLNFNLDYLLNQINDNKVMGEPSLRNILALFMRNLPNVALRGCHSQNVPFVAYMLSYDIMSYKYEKVASILKSDTSLELTSVLTTTTVVLNSNRRELINELLLYPELQLISIIKKKSAGTVLDWAMISKLIVSDRTTFIEMVYTLQDLGSTVLPMHIRNNIIDRYAEYDISLE